MLRPRDQETTGSEDENAPDPGPCAFDAAMALFVTQKSNVRMHAMETVIFV